MIETDHRTTKTWPFCDAEVSPSTVAKSRHVYDFEGFGKRICDVPVAKSFPDLAGVRSEDVALLDILRSTT